jgi:Nif-specific regulatory protein
VPPTAPADAVASASPPIEALGARASACPAFRHDEKAAHERDRLIEAMEAAGWVQAKAARLLGLTTRQVGYALRKHQIAVKKF